MEKIFYADKNSFSSSDEAIQAVLSKYFGINSPIIYRSKNGKPYLDQKLGIFLSVSHTCDLLFLGFSDDEIGIDAESLSRERNYAAVIKKFPHAEQAEIQSNEDFLRHWTAKEAAVKYLGGTLAHDLKKLAFINEKLTYGDELLPKVFELRVHNILLSICAKRDFSHAEIIRLI